MIESATHSETERLPNTFLQKVAVVRVTLQDVDSDQKSPRQVDVDLDHDAPRQPVQDVDSDDESLEQPVQAVDSDDESPRQADVASDQKYPKQVDVDSDQKSPKQVDVDSDPECLRQPVQDFNSDHERPRRPVQALFKSDKWAAALERLSHEDRERFGFAETDQRNAHEVLVDVLEATAQKKKECVEKRWKVTIKGRVIILRDVVEKISVWVSKILKIGDIAIQYDPGQAALPWAAIRLILQATVNDVEVFGWVLQSLESIANLIAVSSIFELRYMQQNTSDLDTADQLSNALVSLYASILGYLTTVLHYYSQRSAVRFVKAVASPVANFEAKYALVQAAKDEAWAIAQLAEAEKAERILAGLDRIENGQGKTAALVFETLENVLALQEPVARATIQLAEIHDGLERDTRARILKAISPIPYSIHHKNARKGRLKGSGEWLLEKPEYRSWRQSSTSSVLWLHGIPGSGKTKLTSLVIDQLEKCDNVAYFYCMRNPAEPQRGRGDQILASLIRQLAGTSSDKPILPPVVAQYEEAIAGLTEFEDQAWTADESGRVLLELMGHHPAATIVLDALDEVNQEDRQELLDILSSLLRDSPNLLKIFISSRDNYDIALHFEGSPNVYIDADDNARDISSFIDDRLKSARLLHNRLPKDLEARIVETLLEGARGMFRWVDLQIQSLRPLKVAADIEARLGALPATLEETYWEIYQEIQESGDHAAALADFAFQWLMYARETLTAERFACIASSRLPSGTASGFAAAEVIDVCANLVVSRNDAFEFAHLSVREFLEGIHKRNVDIFLPVHGNASIAVACLRLLHSQIETAFSKNTGKVKSWKATKHDHAARAVFYAAEYWVHHICESGDMRLKDPLADLIKSFLITKGPGTDAQPVVSEKFRMWCEIMQDKCDNRFHTTERLENSFANPPNPIWLACLYDWREVVGFLYTAKHKDIDAPRVIKVPFFDSTGISSYSEGLSPLWYTILSKKHPLIEIIVSHCADPLQRISVNEQITPLVRAASDGDEECTQLLLRAEHGGLDIETEAFSEAAGNGHATILKMLLAHNDKLLSAAGSDATRKACIGGHTEVVTFLLDLGAPTGSGTECLYAAASEHELLDVLLERKIGLSGLSKALTLSVSEDYKESTALLLKHGSQKEPPAVTRSVKDGCRQAAIRLIKAGFDVSGRYLEKRRAPLHYAAELGYQDVATALLSAGAPATAYDRDGKTPLHLAAAKGHDGCVELLLSNGANVLAEDAQGRIPLDLAEIKGRDSTEVIIKNWMMKLMEELQR